MWDKVKAWFKRSETIFFARLQMFVGTVTAVFMALAKDPTITDAVKAVLKPEYIPYYVIGFGVLTEILRRRRAGL